MNKSRPSSADYPKSSVSFLRSVKNGSDDSQRDIRTPLFDERSREDVSEEWLAILRAYFDQVPGLEALEESQRSKMGPMSFRLPFSDRQATIEAYYASVKSARELKYSKLGYMEQFVRKHTMRPITEELVSATMPQNTSSGLPFFRKRKFVVDESIKLAKQLISFPAMLGWRGQSSGDDLPKQRVVWMFPYSSNIIEGTLTIPLQNHLTSACPNMTAAVSMDAVDKALTALFQAAQRDPDVVILSSDFTKYDQNQRYQLGWIYEYMRYSFQKKASITRTIEWMEENLKEIKLLCTEETMYSGSHGMPSGSTKTFLANTIHNLEAQLSSNAVPDKYQKLMQAGGDDAVLLVSKTLLDAHIRWLTSLGFIMNPDKQLISSESATYLQRYYHVSYKIDGVNRGIYPTMRALNSLMGQERFHKNWDSKMVTLRSIMILENTKWHPAHEAFVKFAMKGDSKMRSNLHAIIDDPTVIEKAKSNPGFVPSYMQEGKLNSGIKSFSSVKIIQNS